ncbi:hypothetical protein [uncultured Shewanella sp.]|uniref:hypothetical protein n=1 Tax=uncultured Shewanella sp. TaxID=173975 RepID=UPI0026041C0E|nr:hypothetical protein [uncultured Shewanella sp.]
MNFNQRLECNTCKENIDCRIGMSNRDVQPISFSCPSCGEEIIIELNLGKGFKYKGAKSIHFDGPFTNENPFIDLHLDFPVKFGEYKMGHTPFMMAHSRIGHENFTIHNTRLNALNLLYPKLDDFKRILRLYSKNKKLFGQLCESKFEEKLRSEKPQDLNLALYCVIAKVFSPFSMPDENADSVKLHMKAIQDALGKDKGSFNAYISEILDTDFLHNIQQDCLDIYPQILEGELAFRPALFLDFDDDYEKELVAFRVSAHDFQTYKDLYKDISEVMSRQLVLVAGLNNLIHRGDFNKFKDIGKATPKSLHAYADLPYGFKTSHLDDCWYSISDGSINNQLRNSIAHVKVEYNAVTQLITYFPKKEGIKQEKSESIYFLDFMRNILISYREMHRMHQLIKCLFNYYYLIHQKAT